MLGMGRYGTNDIVRAKAFYGALADILGAEKFLDRRGLVGWRGQEGVMFMIGRAREGDASVGNGTQLSFVATDPATVDAAHACALAHGATCLGPPGPRGALGIGLYACYFRDPDGNKVMVYHRSARQPGDSGAIPLF